MKKNASFVLSTPACLILSALSRLTVLLVAFFETLTRGSFVYKMHQKAPGVFSMASDIIIASYTRARMPKIISKNDRRLRTALADLH